MTLSKATNKWSSSDRKTILVFWYVYFIASVSRSVSPTTLM